MAVLVLGLTATLALLLLREDRRARRNRAKLAHVVYINGIRGKSTVTRLIAAGLRAGGWSVFCKTTGSVPMVIGVDGVERPLYRSGRANIKEQLNVLNRAARENAQILVIECMAVSPELQELSQDRMVRADIGVITNVRLDHTEEMGGTLEEICDSLCSTLPKDGVLYTADSHFVEQIRQNGIRRNCYVKLALPDDGLPNIDFPENVALALAVCRELGVERERALAGMEDYQPDPYALSSYTLPRGGVFINAMTVNDPESTQMVFDQIMEKPQYAGKRVILLINNRQDRGYRTQHMVMVSQEIRAEEIWLTGASQQVVCRKLRACLPNTPVSRYRGAKEVPLDQIGTDTLVFAVGNIAQEGIKLIEHVRKVGRADVL